MQLLRHLLRLGDGDQVRAAEECQKAGLLVGVRWWGELFANALGCALDVNAPGPGQRRREQAGVEADVQTGR